MPAWYAVFVMSRALVRGGIAALLLGAGLASAQPFLAGLHFATTRHFYCPEHRTLAHGHGEAHGHLGGEAPGAGRRLGVESHEELELDHDACSVVLVQRRLDGGRSRTHWCPCAPCRSAEPGPPRAEPPGSRRVLDVAPKVSPPLSPDRVA